MRVLIAPDEFGGSLTAAEAADAIAEGWLAGAPHDELERLPMSDGGPGFLAALTLSTTHPGDPDGIAGGLAPASPSGSRKVEVRGPLGGPVSAEVLLVGTTAYVESAQACGLHLLAEDARDPRATSSYGVGELILTAVAAGATRVVVGLGGSATNDGGAGMLAALGVSAVDGDGRVLPPGGAALQRADHLVGEPPPALAGVELVAATDVDAPLLGLFGASAVFGPQKGATREDVLALDAALERWADLLEARFGRQVREVAGAGAAGGLGAGLLALGGSVSSGFGLVRDAVGLAQRAASADLVLTGEGSFDHTSLGGKVVSGVAGAAGAEGLPCVVLAGRVTVGRREAAAHGIDAAYSLVDLVGAEAALVSPRASLQQLAARVAAEWSRAV